MGSLLLPLSNIFRETYTNPTWIFCLIFWHGVPSACHRIRKHPKPHKTTFTVHNLRDDGVVISKNAMFLQISHDVKTLKFQESSQDAASPSTPNPRSPTNSRTLSRRSKWQPKLSGVLAAMIFWNTTPSTHYFIYNMVWYGMIWYDLAWISTKTISIYPWHYLIQTTVGGKPPMRNSFILLEGKALKLLTNGVVDPQHAS